MSRQIEKIRKLVYVLAYLVAVLFAAAILAYIIQTNFGKDGAPMGFQLATISAVIGGLVLTSGFLNRGSSKPDLALSLRRIGVIYLMATLAFVVFGICFPLIGVACPFVYASAIGMAVGALCFAMGSVLLAIKIPQLWSSL